ncbi:MAG: Gfo/Idh/MocA family oxidoreductase [Acidobacteria bacterium]|nr:Gfo/Idh/MocA family oxidoreductase [Acidobacteriota bacterium]
MLMTRSLTRRGFLRGSTAGAAGFAASSALSSMKILGANDRVRIGAIGTGGRTRYLMGLLKNLPGSEQVAVCDVYEPRIDEAGALIGASARRYRDYRELLESKDIDAVVIGSPDHWHKQMTVDAVQAGKDVFVEKPVSHSIEEGEELVRAVESSGRVVQTGTQQRSWEHFILGKQIVDSGKLGQITFGQAFWYQNYATRKRLLQLDAAKLDWKAWLGSAADQPVKPERYFLWRWYWDFGGGALTDLMTHWIDVIQWYMGTPTPRTVLTSGQVYASTWECPDTINCVLEYPKDYTVVYTGTMVSRIDDGGLELRGTKGTLKVDRQHLAFYAEESRNIAGTQAPEPEILIRSQSDGTQSHLQNFLDCVRSRKTPTANIRVAHEAARTSHIGNLSLKMGRKVKWNSDLGKIET